MGKYRKIPVVIEAVQYHDTPDSNREVIDFCRGSESPAFMDTEVRNCSEDHPEGFDYPVLKIATLEGDMKVSPGDYVIRGVQGEHYACKPDIFAKTYESAD